MVWMKAIRVHSLFPNPERYRGQEKPVVMLSKFVTNPRTRHQRQIGKPVQDQNSEPRQDFQDAVEGIGKVGPGVDRNVRVIAHEQWDLV